MPTIVSTKRQFIEFLENALDEDHFIIYTQELCGNLTYSKKEQAKKVNFAFAGSAFSRPSDIGHIGFGKTPVMALCICKESDVSELGIKLTKEAVKK